MPEKQTYDNKRVVSFIVLVIVALVVVLCFLYCFISRRRSCFFKPGYGKLRVYFSDQKWTLDENEQLNRTESSLSNRYSGCIESEDPCGEALLSSNERATRRPPAYNQSRAASASSGDTDGETDSGCASMPGA